MENYITNGTYFNQGISKCISSYKIFHSSENDLLIKQYAILNALRFYAYRSVIVKTRYTNKIL